MASANIVLVSPNHRLEIPVGQNCEDNLLNFVRWLNFYSSFSKVEDFTYYCDSDSFVSSAYKKANILGLVSKKVENTLS